jgi:3-methyl-2-oxobutanoate hydroxymethyltransferase
MAYLQTDVTKVTTHVLQRMKMSGEKIAMLTAYDYSMAKLLDVTKIDVVLVGDSAANVMEGFGTTLPITLDEMIVYASSVKRAIKRALVVVDMPFGTYQGDPIEAQRNAVRIMRETGADGVKVEGGREMRAAIEMILRAGIPVMGHLGLTPQSINKFGTYATRAQDEAEATRLVADAKVLAEIGCFGIVLEKIPATLAAKVTQSINVPTIGIGGGGACSGQVLVLHDMLGLNREFKPKFLRVYNNLGEQIIDSVGNYISDVKSGDFPNADEQY